MEDKKYIWIPVEIRNREGEPISSTETIGLKIRIWTQHPNLFLSFGAQDVEETDGVTTLRVEPTVMTALESGVVEYRYSYIEEDGVEVKGHGVTDAFWRNPGCAPHDINGKLKYLIEGLNEKEDTFTPGDGLEMTEDRRLNVTLEVPEAPDLSGYEPRCVIVEASGTELEAEAGKLYRFDEEVDTLAVTLPEVEDDGYAHDIVLHFTTGAAPKLSIQQTGGVALRYFAGFSIEPNTTYELDILYDGREWVVAHAIVKNPEI